MPALLFLAQRLPYPPTKGEKIRALHELRYLSRHYDIHLGCLIDDPSDTPHIDALRPLCRDLYVAPINRRRRRLASLSGLMRNQPLSVAYFRHAGLDAWVGNVLTRIRPEVTFIYSSNMAPYVLNRPATPVRICDLVDVDSEKWRALAAMTHGPMRAIYRREWRKIAALECRVAASFDRCLLVSPAEAALLSRLVSACTDRITPVLNGVDHAYFAPSPDIPSPFDRTAPAFVFTGTMDYPPNIDAVTWFATDILPRLRRGVPAARFVIVGSNPTPDVQRLSRLAGVSVTGRVPDVRPYLMHATAAVAPMRIARGIQNKVLEAMSMARPVVVTSGALEGINAIPGQEVAVADTAEAFAEACRAMLDPSLAQRLGQGSRARVLADYDWNATLRAFDAILQPASVGTAQLSVRAMSRVGTP